MNKITVIFTMLLLMSGSIFAHADASKDLQTIQQWTKNLNNNYKNLDLKPNTSNPHQYGQVLTELDQLDRYLDNKIQLPDGSLVQLACTPCVCDGCAKPK